MAHSGNTEPTALHGNGLMELNRNSARKRQGSDSQQEAETPKAQGWVLGIMGPRADLESCTLSTACGWISGAPEGQGRTLDGQEQNVFPAQHVLAATAALTLAVCNWLDMGVPWCSICSRAAEPPLSL